MRRVLVTGHSRGIGKSIYEEFLSNEDADVIGLSSKECDLRNPSEIKEFFSSVGPVDVLVNNAGIVSKKDILSISIEEWNDIINVNLRSMMVLCQCALPHMISQRYGKIVNIGSIAGLDKSRTASFAYTVSKYGVVGLTKQLAYEYAKHNININCVCPSQTSTEMLLDNLPDETLDELKRVNPSRRLASPEDVSSVVHFLTGENAGYISGECIKVAGGL